MAWRNPEEATYKGQRVSDILKAHAAYLSDEQRGVQANLEGAALDGLALFGADLRNARLKGS